MQYSIGNIIHVSMFELLHPTALGKAIFGRILYPGGYKRWDIIIREVMWKIGAVSWQQISTIITARNRSNLSLRWWENFDASTRKSSETSNSSHYG